MNIIVGPTIVIKVFLLRHRLWMPICLKIVLFLLHCSEKPTFLLSFIYPCDIIWPPAPFESCYLARNLEEVARACSTGSLLNRTAPLPRSWTSFTIPFALMSLLMVFRHLYRGLPLSPSTCTVTCCMGFYSTTFL